MQKFHLKFLETQLALQERMHNSGKKNERTLGQARGFSTQAPHGTIRERLDSYGSSRCLDQWVITNPSFSSGRTCIAELLQLNLYICFSIYSGYGRKEYFPTRHQSLIVVCHCFCDLAKFKMNCKKLNFDKKHYKIWTREIIVCHP